MNYNELSKRAHSNAISHGFWDKYLSDEHCLMLIVTEIAEMVEADRNGDRAGVGAKLLLKQGTDKGEPFMSAFEAHVKNTVEDEMADIVIRLFDLAGHLFIDFNKLPPCRYYRAFRAFSFTENAFALCKGLAKEKIAISKRILFALDYVHEWAKVEHIDLNWHVEMKMAYNVGRPSKHGKKY